MPPTADRDPQLAASARAHVVYGAVAIVLLYIAWTALVVLLLAFAGILLGIFLHGLSRRVARPLRMPYHTALALILFVAAALAVAGSWSFGSAAGRQFQRLWGALGTAVDNLRERLNAVPWMQGLMADAPSPADALLRPDGLLLSTLNWLFQASSWFVVGALVILFVGIYTAADRRAYEGGAIKVFPPERRDAVRETLSALGETYWYWLLGRMLSMAIIGVLSWIVLSWLQIPLPGPLAVIAALLTFIPNIGPTVALIPPVLLALQQGALTALYVTAAYLVIQLLESYLITPLIEERAVSLPPGLIIFMQLVMYMLAGILGLAVATPLTAGGLVLVRRLWIEGKLQDADITREDVRAEADDESDAADDESAD